MRQVIASSRGKELVQVTLVCFVLIHDFRLLNAVSGTLGIFSASALIVAIATMKKVEYASFCPDDSGSVLLNVARSGLEKNQFDSFVNALVIQIDNAKQAAHDSLPPYSQLDVC